MRKRQPRVPPPHSRWEIIEEVRPDVFRVRCRCGSSIEKELAWRYVKGESLSCGCLVRETSRKLGKANLSVLKQGYERYVRDAQDSPPSRYGPKLPDLKTLRRHRKAGLTYQQIADLYDASKNSVWKRLNR